jgi:hypothetical protein
MPYFLADGTVVIPFNSPKRFHWWNGGQPISETKAELEIVNVTQSGSLVQLGK